MTYTLKDLTVLQTLLVRKKAIRETCLNCYRLGECKKSCKAYLAAFQRHAYAVNNMHVGGAGETQTWQRKSRDSKIPGKRSGKGYDRKGKPGHSKRAGRNGARREPEASLNLELQFS